MCPTKQIARDVGSTLCVSRHSLPVLVFNSVTAVDVTRLTEELDANNGKRGTWIPVPNRGLRRHGGSE